MPHIPATCATATIEGGVSQKACLLPVQEDDGLFTLQKGLGWGAELFNEHSKDKTKIMNIVQFSPHIHTRILECQLCQR